MIRLVVLATVFAGCRISLEDAAQESSGRSCKVSTTSQPCLDSASHSDLAWIETKIFAAHCNFSGCHDGAATPQGKVDLRPGMSRAHLVNVASAIEPARRLVVPEDIQASYLMLMVGDVPAAMADPPGSLPSAGLMPQNSSPLCCQNLDVLERWIMAGALTH